MAYETILTELKDGVLTLTLNRPEQLNAYTAQMGIDLADAFVAADADDAARVARDAGASEVLTAVFARKPWPEKRALEPDFVAWEAPGRFLVGYGLDVAGTMRGLPYIGAMD